MRKYRWEREEPADQDDRYCDECGEPVANFHVFPLEKADREPGALLTRDGEPEPIGIIFDVDTAERIVRALNIEEAGRVD
jgi:hypothetical protein